MGCGISSEAKLSASIEKAIEKDKTRQQSHVKLLLLGTGESGKSTLAKQMKLLKLNGFTDQETGYFKRHIQRNLAKSVSDLWTVLVEREFMVDLSTLEPYVAVIQQWLEDFVLVSPQLLNGLTANAIHKILTDEIIAEFLKTDGLAIRGTQDSAFYFIEHHERICQDNYNPTAGDIVRCRVQTTAVEEMAFDMNSFTIHLIDVGGQRGLRKKWITQFDGVKDYYKWMEEDPETNRMVDSIQVFRDVARHQSFKKSAMLIFFNKKDLMLDVLPTIPFSDYWKEYSGQNDYDSVTEYVRKMFLASAPPNKEVFTHFTNATDVENIDKVFSMTISIIIDDNLHNAGLFD